jgi:uncharacterized protein with ATP-grasp and redox domains
MYEWHGNKNNMKTKDRPMETHSAIIESFLEHAGVDGQDKEILRKELKKYVEDRLNRGKWYHPMITKFHTDWYREFYNMIESRDPYSGIKKKSNEIARGILAGREFKELDDMLKLAILGNRIDFGDVVQAARGLNDLGKDIENIAGKKLDIDDSREMEDAIRKAKNVFFLFDNNGEMIFDIPLLEFIDRHVGRENVYLVGKESPMLNDVTVSDLREYGMEKYGRVLSIGSNCFGLHEEDVSDDFKKLFKTADLIIAKGQAYMEFFMEYNFTNVFNVLIVKQDIIGNNIPAMKRGMYVVMSSKRYASGGVDYEWE